ncbi:MAG UNVERIFIED_CONTAM: hypothetical protein LVQ98_00560 [Rickettsiaceae bacterium]|jgi:hypothetical protein
MKIHLDIIKEEKDWKDVPELNKRYVTKVIKSVLEYFPKFTNSEVESRYNAYK